MLHWMDVLYAFRLLRRSPLFTLLTVLVLSGGLGLAVFTFSFLHTAMLKPLPLADGNRIVRISQRVNTGSSPFDAVDAAYLRAGARTLAESGVYRAREFVLGDDEHPRVIEATGAEWNMFAFTRVRAALGRTFTRDDAEAGAEPALILSHRLWKAAYGGDTAIVGRTVLLGGTSTRVVGIMPPGYGFPVASEAWIPIKHDAVATTQFGNATFQMFGRLADGVSAEQARAELRVLYRQARDRDRAAASPAAATQIAAATAVSDVAVQTFPMAQMGDEGPLLFAVLNVLAWLILLLACINVTNLLLARSNERVRETAVRMALGASRGRLVLQSMWESVILCIAGGGVATAIAAWGLGAINGWTRVNLEGNMAFWWVWGIDRPAIIAAGLFVTAAIAALGVVVAGRATSVQFVSVLKDGGARSGGRREGRVVRTLVVVQVATVTVLMFFGVMSGIVAWRVARVDFGFDTRHLLSASMPLDGTAYGEPAARRLLYTRVHDALKEAPAVSGALVRADLAAIVDDAGTIELRNATSAGIAAAPHAYIQALHGDIATLGMHMRAGRMFDSRDGAAGVPVAIISQALAEKFFGGASPVGSQVRTRAAGGDEWRTVIGIASNIMLGPPLSRQQSALAVYVPLAQSPVADANILFAHRGDAPAAGAALHRIVRSLDARLQPPSLQSFDEIMRKTGLIAVSTAKLFASCFAFALLLAVSGTYGLMARSIGQRTREIGVRRALGASDSTVVRQLLVQGGRQLGTGVVFALPIMLLTGIGFARLFPVGVGLTAVSGVLVSGAIVVVIGAATWIPSRRAVGVSVRDALWRE